MRSWPARGLIWRKGGARRGLICRKRGAAPDWPKAQHQIMEPRSARLDLAQESVRLPKGERKSVERR
jgi:hypothetical protein